MHFRPGVGPSPIRAGEARRRGAAVCRSVSPASARRPPTRGRGPRAPRGARPAPSGGRRGPPQSPARTAARRRSSPSTTTSSHYRPARAPDLDNPAPPLTPAGYSSAAARTPSRPAPPPNARRHGDGVTPPGRPRVHGQHGATAGLRESLTVNAVPAPPLAQPAARGRGRRTITRGCNKGRATGRCQALPAPTPPSPIPKAGRTPECTRKALQLLPDRTLSRGWAGWRGGAS